MRLPLIPLLWTAHHVVKSAASTAGGALSDRVGRRATIAAGWAVYALAYAGFALARAPGRCGRSSPSTACTTR